jgi:hypothetical protein
LVARDIIAGYRGLSRVIAGHRGSSRVIASVIADRPTRADAHVLAMRDDPRARDASCDGRAKRVLGELSSKEYWSHHLIVAVVRCPLSEHLPKSARAEVRCTSAR